MLISVKLISIALAACLVSLYRILSGPALVIPVRRPLLSRRRFDVTGGAREWDSLFFFGIFYSGYHSTDNPADYYSGGKEQGAYSPDNENESYEYHEYFYFRRENEPPRPEVANFFLGGGGVLRAVLFTRLDRIRKFTNVKVCRSNLHC
jgi:hypothetical protein